MFVTSMHPVNDSLDSIYLYVTVGGMAWNSLFNYFFCDKRIVPATAPASSRINLSFKGGIWISFH